MDAGFYRGTNVSAIHLVHKPSKDFQIDQDSRYSDKEKKLLKQMKFENVLDQKVIDSTYYA